MFQTASKIIIVSSLVFFRATTIVAQYDNDDLLAHSSPSDCWTVVNSKVYGKGIGQTLACNERKSHAAYCGTCPILAFSDVTSYAGSHPGGSTRIHQMCGLDATNLFNSEHSGHANYMDAMTTYIGTFSGSASSAPVPDSGFCFSAVATVQVQDRGAVKMKDVKIGDKILTGSLDYESIYAFGHHHPTKEAEFLQIHTDDNEDPLEMTGAHMVFVVGKKNPVRANSIQVGDFLQSGGNGRRVQKIASIKREGLYAPLTKDGTLIVNGVKTSAYISLQEKNVEYVELQHGFTPISQHDGIHLVLSPFRVICGTVQAKFCHDYNHDGMPHFIAKGIELIQWFDALDMNIVFQVVIFSLAFAIFSVIMLAEVIMAHSSLIALFSAASFSILFFKTFGIRVPTTNKKMN